MPGNTDLTSLDKEELIHLIQVRGQALEMHHHADAALIEKLEAETITDGDVACYIAAKNDILRHLMTTEEEILQANRPATLAN